MSQTDAPPSQKPKSSAHDPPTPASLQVLFAGGSKISTSKAPLAKSLTDIDSTYADVTERSFTFDLQNYISERIMEITKPMLTKTN